MGDVSMFLNQKRYEIIKQYSKNYSSGFFLNDEKRQVKFSPDFGMSIVLNGCSFNFDKKNPEQSLEKLKIVKIQHEIFCQLFYQWLKNRNMYGSRTENHEFNLHVV